MEIKHGPDNYSGAGDEYDCEFIHDMDVVLVWNESPCFPLIAPVEKLWTIA